MIRNLVEALYPLERHLVSDAIDRSLDIIGEWMPPEADFKQENFPAGMHAWTWTIPERYSVAEAYIETEDGERVVDVADHPLRLMSYSIPVDCWMTWAQLEPHLYYTPLNSTASDVIPFEFSYYDKKWGFCLTKDQFDRLPRDKRCRVVIRSQFSRDPHKGLRIGAARVDPAGGPSGMGELMVCAHICHPTMANDDAAGVAVAVEAARRLAEKPLPPGGMSVRFLICPETIGSIAYFSRHEDLIPSIKGGLFIEMPGNQNTIALQRSFQDSHWMDRIAASVLQKRGEEFRTGEFQTIVSNDEMVMNGPGVNIPTISLSRFPYPEYHTNKDNMEIIHEEKLQEMADVVEEILRIAGSNYIPRRKFRGPIFLFPRGMWIDYRKHKKQNYMINRLMMYMEGNFSLFDIAEKEEMDYWDIWDFFEKLAAHNLIEKIPLPREPFECIQ